MPESRPQRKSSLRMPEWTTRILPPDDKRYKILVDRMTFGRFQVVIVKLGAPGEASEVMIAGIFDKYGNTVRS